MKTLRSEVMGRAWWYMRNLKNMTLSIAMKKAWKKVKEEKSIKIVFDPKQYRAKYVVFKNGEKIDYSTSQSVLRERYNYRGIIEEVA